MAYEFPNSPTIGDLAHGFVWDGEKWLVAGHGTGGYLPLAGGTMTGPITAAADPTVDLHVATKQYVDALIMPADAMAYSGMQINGSMEVNQEGLAATVNGAYACDGWALYFNGIPGSLVAQDSAVPMPGIPSRIYVATTTAKPSLAAADYLTADQRIEGYRIHRLGWGTASAQPITIGFWAQHTLPGTYSVSIRNATTYSRSYVTTYTQNVADVLEYKTITIPGDTAGTWGTINGVGLSISFCAASGSTYTAPSANTWIAGNYVAASGQVNVAVATSNYMVLRGVTILPGIYAPTAAQSPLIMRPYDQELVTCQRYYYKKVNSIFGYNTLSAAVGQQFFHPVTMRSSPTITFSGGTYTNASGATHVNVNADSFRAYAVAIATGQASFDNYTLMVDARL